MDLSSLQKPNTKPPMITLVSPPGVGKTTLAASFPDVIMVQAESISGVFDDMPEDRKPTVFPQLPRSDSKTNVSTLATVKDQLRALVTQEHGFKTLVIDSITSMHSLFEHEVADSYGVDNVADAAGGYHKGYLVVKSYHDEVMKACNYLRDKKGMAIVFIAHLGIEKMKNRPDTDEYTVYTIGMHKESVPVYVNLVDGVFYLRQEEFVKGTQTDKKGVVTKAGKIVQTGERIIVTSGDGRVGYVNAKNRWSLDAEIPLPVGENPLLNLIPFYRNQQQ